MKKLFHLAEISCLTILFLFLLLPVRSSCAPSSSGKTSYSCTETDLKLELQNIRFKASLDSLARRVQKQDSTFTRMCAKFDQEWERLKKDQRDVNRWLTLAQIFIGGVALLVTAFGVGVPIFFSKTQINQMKEELDTYYTNSKEKLDVYKELFDTYQKRFKNIIEEQEEENERLKNMRSGESRSQEDEQLIQRSSIDPVTVFEPRIRSLALQAEKKGNWHAALDYWNVLLHQHPDDRQALFGVGYALDKIKNKYDPSIPEEKNLYLNCLLRAIDIEKHLIELDDQDAKVWYNWGCDLISMARVQSGDEHIRLLNEAQEKFKNAVALQQNKHEAWYNWGNTLRSLAGNYSGKERENLLKDACNKYEAAVGFKRDKSEAWNNWADTLLKLAALATGDEEVALIDDAENKAKMAEEIQAGRGAYNLACVETRRGNPKLVVDWLIISKEKGVLWPGCKHVRKDPDLDNIRDTEEFKQFLAEHCPEECDEGA